MVAVKKKEPKAWIYRGNGKEEFHCPEPKGKLSKAGEWAKAHPNGLDVVYIDWKAVMR